jgi:hypothetical protein
MLGQARPHRVEHDVPANLVQVRMAVHQLSAIAAPEDMSRSLMSPIESLRVDAVQLAHGGPAR